MVAAAGFLAVAGFSTALFSSAASLELDAGRSSPSSSFVFDDFEFELSSAWSPAASLFLLVATRFFFAEA